MMEENRARWHKWASANPERLAASTKAWRDRNRAHINAKSREWNVKNRALKRRTNLKWRKRNPEKAKEIAREYARRRYQTNPQWRLATLARNRISGALKRRKAEKSARTTDLLGCSVQDLRIHLEKQFRPGMTWENYGRHWHVDHIVPCDAFDLTDPEQQRRCFHFSNLQPLPARENIQKWKHTDGRHLSK